MGLKNFFRRRRRINPKIDLDEIFLDSENLPGHDVSQFDGVIEKPLDTRILIFVGLIFTLIVFVFASKAFSLQITHGEDFKEKSENNRLQHSVIFADRGVIYDRNGELLAWNTPKTTEDEFNLRKYIETPGFSNLLGYVKYPRKDSSGFYYDLEATGVSGVESVYNDYIGGENGLQIIETNAKLKVESSNAIRFPINGKGINLTIDFRLQEALYNSVKEIADSAEFVGGGGVIIDVNTGEIIALVTYPEFDSNVMTDSSDREKINSYLNDDSNPFLNRITEGLYTPGSTVKPYMALGALNEGVVSDTTKIVSRGKLEIPNPYDPTNPTIFTDWKAHGSVDIKEALAVSSNIYFYQIGGGYKDQEGIGIDKINSYMRMFGFGKPVGGDFYGDQVGIVPNIKWKEEVFDGDPWRLGDTYLTSIGQYGFQVTPIQAVRALAAVANGGTVRNPTLIMGEEGEVVEKITSIKEEHYKTVRDGMREGVLNGTLKALNTSYVNIAGKTGTAELGVSKQKVNSWVTGFFPYEEPKYAFVIVMEKGDRGNLRGAVSVAIRLFDWMNINIPEYFE
ncbi:MAG: penicillin-binding protein 2 [Candidatus Paceibacteria bacterium]|jgi:penicillin-binding protein 2